MKENFLFRHSNKTSSHAKLNNCLFESTKVSFFFYSHFEALGYCTLVSVKREAKPHVAAEQRDAGCGWPFLSF